MTKPLELTVFEKEPGRYGREPLYSSPDGYWAYPASHADAYALNKQFTESEMASMYWSCAFDVLDMKFLGNHEFSQKRLRESVFLHRFATRPHASETNYE